MAAKKKRRYFGRKKASGGGGRRRGRSRRKPKQSGVAGKIGAFMLGVMPPAIAGVATFELCARHYKRNGGLPSTIKIGLLQFCNELSNGLVGVQPFKGPVQYVDRNGALQTGSLGASLPAGSLLSVAGTGLLMIGFDWIASKLSGGHVRKIPFTNYNATGSV